MKKFFKYLLIIYRAGDNSRRAAAILITDALTVNIDRKKLEGNIMISAFTTGKHEITQADILHSKKAEQKLSVYTYNAFIAVEDKRFYQHKELT
jgi:membrane peptidoglycan carboxypeptidase